MSQLRKDLHDLNENGELGDWCFAENDTVLLFRHPSGQHEPYEGERGSVSGIPIANNPLPNGACWAWDGNHEAPTIRPSINVVGMWHGFMTVGKLINA